MTSFGSGLEADEALGGTSTSGVTGIEAGDGLALFFGTLGALGGWLPELQKKHKSISKSLSVKPELGSRK
jgi:hypothetical protein